MCHTAKKKHAARNGVRTHALYLLIPTIGCKSCCSHSKTVMDLHSHADARIYTISISGMKAYISIHIDMCVCVCVCVCLFVFAEKRASRKERRTSFSDRENMWKKSVPNSFVSDHCRNIETGLEMTRAQ